MVGNLAGEGAKENDLEVDKGYGPYGIEANGDDDKGCHRNGVGASLSARTMFSTDFGISDWVSLEVFPASFWTIYIFWNVRVLPSEKESAGWHDLRKREFPLLNVSDFWEVLRFQI